MKVSRSRSKKVLQEFCDKQLAQGGNAGQIALEASPEAFSERNLHAKSFEQVLLARGIRLTEQRRAILKVIGQAPHCANVGIICRRAQSLNPRINRATVYRTVALLKRHGVVGTCGLASTCALGVSPSAAAADNQVRMKCLGCTKTFEFDCCLLGEFTACIEKDCKFRISTAQLDLQGYCRQCRTLETGIPTGNPRPGRTPNIPTTAD